MGGDRGGSHTRFTNKRSRSRSPARSTTRFDSVQGNDFKRARTDTARPLHVSLVLFHILS
jgi:hypothetical protein